MLYCLQVEFTTVHKLLRAPDEYKLLYKIITVFALECLLEIQLLNGCGMEVESP